MAFCRTPQTKHAPYMVLKSNIRGTHHLVKGWSMNFDPLFNRRMNFKCRHSYYCMYVVFSKVMSIFTVSYFILSSKNKKTPHYH